MKPRHETYNMADSCLVPPPPPVHRSDIIAKEEIEKNRRKKAEADSQKETGKKRSLHKRSIQQKKKLPFLFFLH